MDLNQIETDILQLGNKKIVEVKTLHAEGYTVFYRVLKKINGLWEVMGMASDYDEAERIFNSL